MDNITTENQKVGIGLLGGESKKYIVPKFQRSYTWSKNDWEMLYKDLDTDKDHFLGMFVFVNGEENSVSVIDGQQRLITLSLLYLAFARWACELICQKQSQSSEINSNNLEIHSNLVTLETIFKHIYLPPKQGEAILSKMPYYDLRLELSLCNDDNENYQKLCSGVINACLDQIDNKEKYEEPKGKSRICNGYKYFYSKIKADFDSLDKIRSNVKILNDSWEVVTISVPNEMDACILFDSLNNRGVPLSPVDIIKNKLFSQLNLKNKNILDQHDNNWSQMVENLETPYNLKKYFVDYYNINRASNYKNGFIENIVATSDSKLIQDYSKFIENLSKKSSTTVDILFTDLCDKSEIYAKLFVSPDVNINTKTEFDLKYKWQLVALTAISGIPSYVLLFYIYNKLNLNASVAFEKERILFYDVVEFLGKYFVRRHLTDLPKVRDLSTIFIQLINKYENSGNLPTSSAEIINDVLITSKEIEHKEYLDLPSLTNALCELEYEPQKQKQEIIRYLFTIIEYSHESVNINSKDAYKSNYTTQDSKSKVQYESTIEHIVPQGTEIKNKDDKVAWEKMLGEDMDKDKREEFVHCLGNLTLCTHNQDIGQWSFERKKEEYINEGKRIINDFIINSDTWNRSKVDERTQLLAEELTQLLAFNGK